MHQCWLWQAGTPLSSTCRSESAGLNGYPCLTSNRQLKDFRGSLWCACRCNVQKCHVHTYYRLYRLHDVQDLAMNSWPFQHSPQQEPRHSVKCCVEVNKAAVQLASHPFMPCLSYRSMPWGWIWRYASSESTCVARESMPAFSTKCPLSGACAEAPVVQGRCANELSDCTAPLGGKLQLAVLVTDCYKVLQLFVQRYCCKKGGSACAGFCAWTINAALRGQGLT